MDCQLVIHLFTYIHYQTFVASRVPTVEKLLVAASFLPLEQQLRLYSLLGDQVQQALSSLQG